MLWALQPGSSRPNTAPGKIQRPVRLKPIHSNSTTASLRRSSPYRLLESSNEHDQPFNCTVRLWHMRHTFIHSFTWLLVKRAWKTVFLFVILVVIFFIFVFDLVSEWDHYCLPLVTLFGNYSLEMYQYFHTTSKNYFTVFEYSPLSFGSGQTPLQ